MKNFPEISKHDIKLYFFNYVDDNLTDFLFIVFKEIIVLKEIIKYGVKSLNQLRLNEKMICLK